MLPKLVRIATAALHFWLGNVGWKDLVVCQCIKECCGYLLVYFYFRVFSSLKPALRASQGTRQAAQAEAGRAQLQGVGEPIDG